MKNLVKFAAARYNFNQMRVSGVPEAVATQAVGPIVDIVPVHPASDEIWGPIV